MAIVLDASATLAWLFEDEADANSDAIRIQSETEGVVVPHYWTVEVANAVLKGERRRRTVPDDSAAFFEYLGQLEVSIEAAPAISSTPRILAVARTHHISVYDAGYLELAQRRSLGLATLDAALAAAARRAGVEVLSG